MPADLSFAQAKHIECDKTVAQSSLNQSSHWLLCFFEPHTSAAGLTDISHDFAIGNSISV